MGGGTVQLPHVWAQERETPAAAATRAPLRLPYNSFTPQDQPPGLMPVDEQLDLYGSVVLGTGAAGQGQGGQQGGQQGQGKQHKARPASAGGRPAAVRGPGGGRPASAGPRPASWGRGGGGDGEVVAGAAGKGKAGHRGARRGGHEYEHGGGERPGGDGGGGGGGGGALSAEELARWDGMEFRPEPYQRPSTAPPYSTAARGEEGEEGGLVGQKRVGAGPRLSIQTPVPIFDSPHDPAYVLLTQQWQGVQQARARGVTFAHAGPEATRKGGAPRGGSGGAGGGGGGGRGRGNVNSVVPYKDSPAGLRRAF